MITSSVFCFSRSSSWRSRTTPVSRSTLKMGPEILYPIRPPSGSVPKIQHKNANILNTTVYFFRNKNVRNGYYGVFFSFAFFKTNEMNTVMSRVVFHFTTKHK